MSHLRLKLLHRYRVDSCPKGLPWLYVFSQQNDRVKGMKLDLRNLRPRHSRIPANLVLKL